MNKKDLRELLEKVRSNEVDIETALNSLKDLPYKDIGLARVDNHRSLRNGFPEVIYCEGKSLEEIKAIITEMLKTNNNILASRASQEIFEMVKEIAPDAIYHPRPKNDFY